MKFKPSNFSNWNLIFRFRFLASKYRTFKCQNIVNVDFKTLSGIPWSCQKLVHVRKSKIALSGWSTTKVHLSLAHSPLPKSPMFFYRKTQSKYSLTVAVNASSALYDFPNWRSLRRRVCDFSLLSGRDSELTRVTYWRRISATVSVPNS